MPSRASDAINNVLGTHPGVFWDCAHAHNLTFQIGGKLFPLDPRDFYTNDGRTATECTSSVQDRRLSSSSSGREKSAPYNWTLGVPFLKSNAVVFYFGNLTHPSADPPKVGLVSLVPEDAGALLQEAGGEAGGASANLPGRFSVLCDEIRSSIRTWATDRASCVSYERTGTDEQQGDHQGRFNFLRFRDRVSSYGERRIECGRGHVLSRSSIRSNGYSPRRSRFHPVSARQLQQWLGRISMYSRFADRYRVASIGQSIS